MANNFVLKLNPLHLSLIHISEPTRQDTNDCQIFDSGTSLSEDGKLLTNGGRVLSIVCQDKDFDMVFEKAYKNLKKIHFEGIYFRNDIGYQVRKKFSKEN